MRSPAEVVANLLGRWTRETITLRELVPALMACGWSKRRVYAYLEAEADHNRGFR